MNRKSKTHLVRCRIVAINTIKVMFCC